MHHYKTLAATAALLSAVTTAHAEVVGGTNIDLSVAPFTISLVSPNNFTLTFAPVSPTDFSSVSVRTTGTAQVSASGGFNSTPFSPLAFFPDSAVSVDEFLSFASFPLATRIEGSTFPSDLGLRYRVGTDSFFGYARFAGPTLFSFGFETQANTGIIAGATIDRLIAGGDDNGGGDNGGGGDDGGGDNGGGGDGGDGGVVGPIPEPSTWAMMIGGFGAIGGALRNRQRGNRLSRI